MYESVVFLSRLEALGLLPDPDAVMISLIVPNALVCFAPGWKAVLQLEIDDIYEEALGMAAGSIPDELVHFVHEFGAPNYGMAIYRLPNAAHAKAIAKFLAQHEGGCCVFRRVIVHCNQGKSRSAAVAQFVADKYNVPLLNADPAWQDRVAMPDTSRANPRLLRLLQKQKGCGL